jgi:hypothetical protein
VRHVESPWWQTNFWTIIEVLIAIGSLILGIITFLTAKSRKKRSKKNSYARAVLLVWHRFFSFTVFCEA